jgi:hypothetical protein
MARQYSNISAFVSSIGYTLKTTVEEYTQQDKKSIEILCPNNHCMSFIIQSFKNKKVAYDKGKYETFCAICVKEVDTKESEQKAIEKIESFTGHKVLSIDISSRKVVYLCKTCGKENNGHVQNLLKNKGYCRNCENDHQKLSFDDVKQRVEKMGLTLLTKKEEYVNNKMKLSLLCACGEVDSRKLSDIEKGKRCAKNCKLQRFKDTCMEKYGVQNVSQDPKIFAKITKSLFKRKEFTFPDSGRTINLLGYEPQAIDYLLDQKEDKYLKRAIEEDEIRVGVDIPSFSYTDIDGKERVYHPDFAIEDMIIEVKGDWTLHKWKDTNLRKFKAVVEKGYKLRLLLFYENGEIQEDILNEEDVRQVEELEFRDKGRRY